MMLLPDDLTIETADAGLTSARERLAARVADGHAASSLAADVNSIAEAEGRSQAIRLVVSLRSRGTSWADVLIKAADFRTDDTWSGRENDARRAKADGYLEIVRVVKFAAEMELEDRKRADARAEARTSA